MTKHARSDAQRAASRANGRLSRGPKSADGKKRSRRNALRHGLRARSLELLPSATSRPAALLAEAVRQKLAPRDAIESECVDNIAMAFWRLRRARQIEEMLLAGDQPEHDETGIAKAFLRRSSGASAVSLLLRYRNQALGELYRLSALLEVHRDTAEGPAVAPAADRSTAESPGPAAANDNLSPEAAPTATQPERPLS